MDANLLLTAGNDYAARLLDLRVLGGKQEAGAEVPRAELASLQHSKVINAAYFSPITGRKILTTSQDNRLRVWDYVYTSDQVRERWTLEGARGLELKREGLARAPGGGDRVCGQRCTLSLRGSC